MAALEAGHPRPRGGPRTPAGKAVSRTNALKHGFSATTLFAEIFDAGLLERRYDALCEEWCPATPTQKMLVRDLARHAVALERIEQIEPAVLRRGASNPLHVNLDFGSDGQRIDAILAAAGTSEAVEKISRYRRQHERALLRVLAALQEVQKRSPVSSGGPPRQSFSTEDECDAYLVDRVKRAAFPCPRCGGRRGAWLAARRAWQCRNCRKQRTLRHGTLMASSRVALLPWFSAIEVLIRNPHASIAELAAATKLTREGTIRRMAEKIRKALAAPDRSQLLAGLDAKFGQPG